MEKPKPKLRPEDWEAGTEAESIAEQRAQAGLEFMEKGAKRTKEGRLNITQKQWEVAHKEMEKKIGKKKEEITKAEAAPEAKKSQITREQILEAIQAAAETESEEERKKWEKELVAFDEFNKPSTEIFEKAQAMEATQKFEEAKKISEEKIRAEKTKEARWEGGQLQKELEVARERFASTLIDDPKYGEAKQDYDRQIDFMKQFIFENKRDALERNGLTSEEIEKELDKYAREYIAPHFAAFEAAKIQSAKEEANPSFIEKMKDGKFSKVAYDVIDKYRKASVKDKMLISVGLIGTGLAAGVFGGTFGTLIAGGVAVGKFGQRILGGAGAGIVTEALIQKSQQKWLEKEGWGKNRKEYILKQLDFMRKRVREGRISAEITEKEGAKEIEKLLDKRQNLLKKLETKRTVIGASVGLLFGTGVVFKGARYLGDVLGINERLSDFFSWKGEAPKGAISPKEAPTKLEIKILPKEAVGLEIGTRGPEGAIIDHFKNNPELAKQFGWDDKTDLSEWAGGEAHRLWVADMTEALENPKTLADLEKLGYSQDAEGYTKMMHKIGKGVVKLDMSDKSVDLVDMDYLKNSVDHLKNIAGNSAAFPDLSESEKMLYNLVDQDKMTEYEKQMQPFMDDMVNKLKDRGLGAEDIMERQDMIVSEVINEMKNRGITIDASVLNVENLQKIMETPEGKLGAVISKLANIEQKNLNSIIARVGGWDKFMNSSASSLFESEGGPIDISLSKIGMELKRLTGDAPFLYGTASIKEILKSIKSKDIFGGSAKELLEKGM